MSNEVSVLNRALEVAAAENRRLRAEVEKLRGLVVSCFNHDHPPTFKQGYPTHELEEVTSAEQCTWMVGEIERLRDELAALREQEPVAAVQWMQGRPVLRVIGDAVLPPETPLYAAPVAQSAVSVPEGWALCSADFSVQAVGNSETGRVRLVRDAVGRRGWHRLSEDEQDRVPLYVIGEGRTIHEALANAAKAAMLAAAPEAKL